MIYALDTNTVSYLIQGNQSVIKRLKQAISQDNTIVIPPTTYYEIKRGFKHKSAPGKEFAFSLICQTYEIGEMNIVTWDKAADIYAHTRKSGNTVDDNDILIAAFCVVNGYTVVTNNVKHFDIVEGLAVVDWSTGRK